MNRKSWVMLILTSLIALSLLSACGLARNTLIGRWTGSEDSSTYFEFFDTGKLHTNFYQGAEIQMDFQFYNDTTLGIPAFEVLQLQPVVQYRYQGSQLVLNLGGQEIILNRAR
jgi:hypothetical protein